MSGGSMKKKRPFQRKHVWSESEDCQLAKLVSQYGVCGSWSTIAQEMDSRNGKQCRERYVNHLNPNIKRTPWLPEEDNLIEQLYGEFGSQWSRFMKNIPGRSDNAIKNRWHLLKRASKLAATMQNSNPSSVISSSSSSTNVIQRCSSVDQSTVGIIDEMKTFSMSIGDDTADSSLKHPCFSENNSSSSEVKDVRCISMGTKDESDHENKMTDYCVNCSSSTTHSDGRNRSNSFEMMTSNIFFDDSIDISNINIFDDFNMFA